MGAFKYHITLFWSFTNPSPHSHANFSKFPYYKLNRKCLSHTPANPPLRVSDIYNIHLQKYFQIGSLPSCRHIISSHCHIAIATIVTFSNPKIFQMYFQIGSPPSCHHILSPHCHSESVVGQAGLKWAALRMDRVGKTFYIIST